MATPRWTAYTTGTEGLSRSIEGIADRQSKLELLSAQLKVQEKIADERNKTTLEAARIGQETQFGVTEKRTGSAEKITDVTTASAEEITKKKIASAEKITTETQAGATTRVGLQTESAEKIADVTTTSAEKRTGMQITSAEKQNLENIASQQLAIDKKITADQNIRTLIEGGLNTRLATKISGDLNLANLSHAEAMKRLEKQLGTSVDIAQMKEDGSLARMVKQVQSNEFIAEVKETGAMDRIVKQLTSTENLAGLDNEQKMLRLRESIAGDTELQGMIQDNLTNRQILGQDFKMELSQYLEGETNKRLSQEIESREAIQVMLEQGRSTRDSNQFLYNTELQLGRENARMAQQIESQEHETGMAEQKFEQAKELGNVNFEREVLRSILGIKMKGEAERQSFNFLASPFSLGKTSGMLGINYKEQDVLDQVGKNLPTLAEAVRVARNIPDDISIEEGGWFSKDKEVSTMVPKKAQLLKVLLNYENELSGSQFYNWGESKSTKKDAKEKLGDVRSLMEMLKTSSSNPYESIGATAPYN